jgi:hypothetical protein
MKNQGRKFQVNKFLSLKLEDEKTNIYISGELFRQCKYLLIDIPIENVSSLDELESIDETAEKLDHTLEPRLEKKQFTYTIPPKVEFWGHCSNLQVWYENGYNTKLLHVNLAFPLLKQLTRAGDHQAKKVFKEEIAKRYNYGVESVREYLRSKKYIWEMTDEEFLSLIEDEGEYETLKQILKTYPKLEKNERGALTLKLNLDIKKGEVVKLDLSALELTRIPEEIRDFSSLEHLNISHNSLKELPKWIGEFKALKVLRITDNQLKTLPNSIGSLNSLEEFYARGNQLETIPEAIGNIKSLKILELYQNKLKTMPETIGELLNLVKLDLHENELSFLPSSIGRLLNLKKLRLQRNQLKTLSESIGNLRKLKSFNLEDNYLGHLPSSIGNLLELELLAVSQNPLYDIPDSLYKLPKLRDLWVTETQLNKYQVDKKKFKNETIRIHYSFFQKKKR